MGTKSRSKSPKPAGKGRSVSFDEVSKHASEDDCWLIIGGEVYDCTEFAPEHPGGAALLHKYAGRDCTEEFLEAHPLDIIATTLPDGGVLAARGKLSEPTSQLPKEAFEPRPGYEEPAEAAAAAPAAADAVPPIAACLNLFDYEAVAKVKMAAKGAKGKNGWDYYASGADDEVTLRENHSAFHRIWIKPRVCVNVKDVDTSASFLGQKTSFPLYLSAVALQKLGHPDGELAWIRAAKAQGVGCMIPTLASCGQQEMFGEGRDLGQALAYQLYVNPNRDVCKKLVQDAEKGGCKALFITVDAPQLGRRERDMRNKLGNTAAVMSSGATPKPAATGTSATLTTFIDPALCWDDVKWFKSITKMPIVLKGVQTAEDALLAFEKGCAGIVVSNHGGRQLDFSRSGIEVLPEVMEALRKKLSKRQLDGFDVYVDGGVRRGTDILKALALGAKAVGIGKPVTYSMCAYGQQGIEGMLSGLRSEFINAMRLCGCTSVDQIGPELLDLTHLSSHQVLSPTDHYAQSTYDPVRTAQSSIAAAAAAAATAAVGAALGGGAGGAGTGAGGKGRANNYGVPSNFPASKPRTVCDVMDIEELEKLTAASGKCKLCRCYKSKTWPLCDDAHNEHNSSCGDNAGPLVVKARAAKAGGSLPAFLALHAASIVAALLAMAVGYVLGAAK